MMRRLSRSLLALGVLFLAAGQCHADFKLLVAENGANKITSVAQNGATTTFASTFLDRPIGLGINPVNGDVYAVNNGVSSTLINTVSRFDSTGAHLNTFGGAHLNAPVGITFDATGNVYVSGWDNTIQEFNATGTYIGLFANTGLNDPYGMTFDSAGNLYVANYGDSSIEKFSSTGTDLGVFTTTALDGPTGLVIGPNGNLFVSNFSTALQNPLDTITEYKLDGTFVGTFTSADISGLSGPIGLAFAPTGDLFVANNFNNTLESFKSDGTDNGTFATGFNGPTFIAFVVPEPSSVVLLSLGFVGMLTVHRHRRNRSQPVSA